MAFTPISDKIVFISIWDPIRMTFAVISKMSSTFSSLLVNAGETVLEILNPKVKIISTTFYCPNT
jgi:hypothetical protein